MTWILVLGFLIGMRHALEADHLAAVASMASDGLGVRRAALRGAVWGIGHTLTLFVVGGICLLVDATMPVGLQRLADIAVGAMLVFLGAQVVWRVRRQGVHLHAHAHEDGTVHLHAHAHPPAAAPTDHRADPHQHRHGLGFPRRALVVGLVHGMAGSAALLLLTLSRTGSPMLGLAYIGLFGLGSILGMAALSSLIAIPLSASTRLLSGLYGGLQGAIGVLTIALGVWILFGALAAS